MTASDQETYINIDLLSMFFYCLKGNTSQNTSAIHMKDLINFSFNVNFSQSLGVPVNLIKKISYELHLYFDWS